MSAATNFLGSGLTYPFRQGKGGLPDLEFSIGTDSISGAVDMLLKTSPGDYPFDPALGLDPEIFRFDATDDISRQDIQQRMRLSLIDADPRIRDGAVIVAARPSQGLLDIAVSFRPILSHVPENRVRLPTAEHLDSLRVIDQSASAISGFNNPLLIGISP